MSPAGRRPLRTRRRRTCPDITLGEALLTPTTIYAPHLLAVAADLASAGLRLGGLAHVTGGGLPGNLPRSVGSELGIRVHPAAWPVPPIVALVAALAGLDGPATRATFNGGIGMAVVVEPAATDRTLGLLAGRGIRAWVIGDVVPAEVAGPGRYVEAGGRP